MKMVKCPSGRFVKDGTRFRVVVPDGERRGSLRATAEADGYAFDPLPPLEEAKARKKAQLARSRWQEEVGGITVGDLQIDSSDKSRQRFSEFCREAEADPSFKVAAFKTKAGTYVTLNAKTIIRIDKALKAQLRELFVYEEASLKAVDEKQTEEEVAAFEWRKTPAVSPDVVVPVAE